MTDQVLMSSYLGILPQTAEHKVLQLMLETAIEVLAADEGSILVYDEPSKTLRFAMTVGDSASAARIEGQSVPIGKGLVGLAAVTREVQIGAPIFHDIHQTRRLDRESDEPEAVIAAPMLIGETLIGVLTVVSFRHEKRFGAIDAKLFARCAAIAAFVVDQRRRIAAVEQRDHDLLSGSGLTASARAEQQIFASLARIVKRDEAALAYLAQIVQALEALVTGRKGQ
jgi:transcriptional regulator with GAF, ATPase, and Fis domain